MELEVGKFYEIAWRRPSLYEGQTKRTDKIRGLVQADNLKTNDGQLCYRVMNKDGKWVAIKEDSIISAKPYRGFTIKALNIKPTNKGRTIKKEPVADAS